MLSPNVPEFVPRGMQPTGPTGGYERTIPPAVERLHTSQSSIQTIRAERKEEDWQRRQVQNASSLEPERRDSKESFGGKKGGGSNRGRHGSYSSYTRDRDSFRSYDNWRQRVDENPTDRQGSYFKSTRRPTKGDSEGDCNKNRSQHGKQRPWKQKGESQERENVQNKEGKKTVGRGKNIALGPTHATETQSPSYCKPGVSYGKILAGDFAWGGKTSLVGDGGNHPKTSNDSGLISNGQQEEQWPSLPGFHTRALAKGERVEAESPRGRETSLAQDGAMVDSMKDSAIKESNTIGKEAVEVTRVEKEDLSWGKLTSSDEKKVGEKDDERQTENAIVCEIRRNENAVKEGHTGQRHDSLDLKPVPREGEKKYTNRSPRGKVTNSQQPEEKEDGNFEWQVKRDRRKQVKPQEETTKLSVLVQQQKGVKNRKGKADVNPSFAKGKAVSKSETKSTNQHTMKNKPHVIATSANKINRKMKQNPPGQQDQSAVEGPGVSSLADKASAKNNGSVPVDAKKPITSEKDSSKLKAKKLKKKEEKMKIREQQIRKAQEMMKKDSKLSMITKAFLESAAYTGSGGQTSRMSKTAGQSLFENFPSLGEQSPYIVKRNVKGNVVPPATSKSGSHEDSRERKKPRNPSVPLASQASGSGTASGSITSPSVSSYSGVLLASPRRAAESQSRAMDDSQVKDTRNVVAQKKKVKTRDRIELDLMCAALESKKRKEKELSDKILMSELHPGLEKPKRSMETHTVIKGSKNAFAGHLRAKAKGTAPATTLFRGFQREGREHKYLSPLKKRMKKARLQEAETLLAIVREAKKAQERLIQESLSQSAETIVEDEAKLSESSQLLPSSSPELPKDEIINEKRDLKDVNGCDGEGSSVADVGEEELKGDSLSASEGLQSATRLSVDGTEAVAEPQDMNSETQVTQEPQSISDARRSELEQDMKNMDQESTSNKKIVNTTTTVTNKDIKKVIKDIHALDISPARVGGLLANLDDPELAKRCSELAQEIKIMAHPVHKMSFREYCDHMITPEVDSEAKKLVTMLVKFQERQYQRDPIKAKIRRRYVCGLKETTKLMTKMSCVIVAPDIQRSRGPGLLDEVVAKMLNRARESGVPLIFALSLKNLGKLCHKSVPVSCIGIINYQGAQDVFNQLMELVPAAKAKYQALVNTGLCTVPAEAEGLSDEEKEPEGSLLKDAVTS
ncbi:microtubule-associated protein futsch-like [Penaeus chinensis]|uniref:microtubule-associated protein futsch-like n=1 Tax=Penaeus chinensis TaxID=139456 RepID=UPI001FB5BE05|nr:microtubule-associated protein futsch-like [Penaeus chinensis]XP_047480381.1 microtubule-associated protein futsch-like [Penaeus chinensis]